MSKRKEQEKEREREGENEVAPTVMCPRKSLHKHGVTFTGDVSDSSPFLVAVDTNP